MMNLIHISLIDHNAHFFSHDFCRVYGLVYLLEHKMYSTTYVHGSLATTTFTMLAYIMCVGPIQCQYDDNSVSPSVSTARSQSITSWTHR